MTTPMQRLPRDLPAPTTATAVITRLLTTAASQIGYREGRSSSGSWNNDNAFGKWYGTNGVAWCAQFVSWAAFAAGIPETVIPKHQYTPTGWNWFTARDRDVTTPRAGDIFYVYGYVSSEGRSRVHHVGIVEKVLSGGRIQTIEGNTNTSGSAQGNGVYRLIRPISTTKLRFARPNYAAAVQTAAPAKPPTGGTVTPPTPEDNMPTPEETRTIVRQENEKYGARLWANPTGTGTKFIASTRATLANLTTQVAGLTAAVKALAEQQGVDPDAIVAAVENATKEALADLKITLAVDDEDEPTTPEA